MCWSFYHQKESEKNKVLIYSTKQNWAVLCFYANNNTKLRQSTLGANLTSWKNLYDILQIFFAQKEGIFASWKRPKKLLFCKLSFTFVIFYHFINLYQNLCYQSASLSLFIVFKTSFIMFIISKWKTLISTFITISFYQTWSCLSTSLLKRKGDIFATVFIIKTDKAKMFMTSREHNQVLEVHRYYICFSE